MKFGIDSAILPDCSYQEVIEFASEYKFKCVEMMCWPKGKAERRYAGVSHIDVNVLDDDEARRILDFAAAHDISISSLGYYPNPLDPDPIKSAVYIEHIKKLILASAKLRIGLVTTFIGKDPKKTIDENIEKFIEVWIPIVAFAEANKVKIGIENCPMYFTMDEWPGGLNLASSPAIWRRLFEAIPSPYFGLNYDPSHMVLQFMDYIKPIYEFRDRIFHVHFKDIKIFKDKLDDVGSIMAPTLEYSAPKLPGLGDIDWGKFVSALMDIRYEGPAVIEIEDKAFEDSLDSRKKAILLSKNFLSQYVL